MTDPLTVLVDAVSRGDVEAASAILAADPALARQEQGGATPLHYAAVHGQTSAVDLLIDHGADLEALDQEYGAAPIGWANEKGYMDLVRHMRLGFHIRPTNDAVIGFNADQADVFDAGCLFGAGWGGVVSAGVQHDRLNVGDLHEFSSWN